MLMISDDTTCADNLNKDVVQKTLNMIAGKKSESIKETDILFKTTNLEFRLDGMFE